MTSFKIFISENKETLKESYGQYKKEMIECGVKPDTFVSYSSKIYVSLKKDE